MLTEKFFISSEQLEEFYEIFRKVVTYDNIKSHKNQGFALSFTFLKKPQGWGGQTDPLPPAVLEFKLKIFMTSS